MVGILKTKPSFAFICDAGLEAVRGGKAKCSCKFCVGRNVVCLAQTEMVPEKILDLELV